MGEFTTVRVPKGLLDTANIASRSSPWTTRDVVLWHFRPPHYREVSSIFAFPLSQQAL